MYLNIREPLMITTTPFLILKPDPKRTGQAERAAYLMSACAKHYTKVLDGSLAPDMEKENALDMVQHTRLFSTARIPKPGRDKMITYSNSKHAAVISRNQIFIVDLFDESGKLVPEENLIFSLNNIIERSKAQSYPDIPTLTAGYRDSWAQTRAHMEKDSQNASSLEKIDSAMMVMQLDDISPENIQAASGSTLHR